MDPRAKKDWAIFRHPELAPVANTAGAHLGPIWECCLEKYQQVVVVVAIIEVVIVLNSNPGVVFMTDQRVWGECFVGDTILILDKLDI